MGINMFLSSSSFDDTQSNDGNPNPENYTIQRNVVSNGYIIIEIKYHDCNTYEGNKIMVYDCTIDELTKQKYIDPHFSDNEKYHSPIARFEPTDKGWQHAKAFVYNIEYNQKADPFKF